MSYEKQGFFDNKYNTATYIDIIGDLHQERKFMDTKHQTEVTRWKSKYITDTESLKSEIACLENEVNLWQIKYEKDMTAMAKKYDANAKKLKRTISNLRRQ